MRNSVFAVIGFLLTTSVKAQCDIVLVSSGAAVMCQPQGLGSSVGAVYVEAQWSLGVPPFSVTFLGPGWSAGGTDLYAFDYSGFGPGILPHDTQVLGPCVVTVTDAMGCASSQSIGVLPDIWYDNHSPFSVLFPGFACGNATADVHILDNGSDVGNFMSSMGVGTFTYELYRNSSLQSSGNLLQAWQPMPPRVVLNGLVPGAYTMVLSQFANATGVPKMCPEWTEVVFTVPGPGDCVGLNIRGKAGLSGAGALPMSDALRAGGLVPLTEPYSGLGYTYNGPGAGVSITPGMLTAQGVNSVVDWMVNEVRTPGPPYTVLASKPVLVQRDGDLMDTDGDPYINVQSLPAGSYHIALRHRNHLGVMTGGPVALGPGATGVTVDFTEGGFAAFGTSARKVVGSAYALWSGDVTGNGTIAYTGAANDRDPILVAVGGSTPTATLNGQYRREDVNMDGTVKYTGTNNDRDPILQNIGGTTPTNTRIQQLP